MDGGIVSRASVRVVPYQPEHLRAIAVQPHQEHLGAFLSKGTHAEDVAKAGPCWTVLANGTPITCAGFQEQWEGRAIVWAVLAESAGEHMLSVTRAARRAMDTHPAVRIEAQADLAFKPGLRWARLLGFEPEAVFRKFHLGRDYQGFVFLKPTL